MNEKLQWVVERYGYASLLRLPFYPLTLLLTMPYYLLRTLWNARLLASGRWTEYNRFHVTSGINSLFYWTQALNIDRYGRGGRSPYLGLGDYHLGGWFHNSLCSLYAYWKAGAVLPLLSMLFWWASHVIWLEGGLTWWSMVVMLLALISTTFFGAAFTFLNYNAFGWAFFPVGLWGMLTGHYLIAAMAWLAASLGSFTVVILAAMLGVAIALHTGSVLPLVSVMPAMAKLAVHFYWMIDSDKGILDGLARTAKSIGVVSRGVKYTRKSRKLDITVIYFLVLYSIFPAAWYASYGEIPVYWMVGMAIFALNAWLVRFADQQSIYMLMFSIGTAMMFSVQLQQPSLLLAYWLVVSPLPLLMGVFNSRSAIDRVSDFRPFHVRPLIEKMKGFLSPVDTGQRVLVAFDNPGNSYEKIFDGYRTILELPLYVASLRKIHFMPDWWAVFQCNYPGAPEFWGRSPAEVKVNLERWSADFVVIYQESETKLEAAWADAGFEPLTVFDWGILGDELQGETPWKGCAPKWWLLRRMG